VKAWLPPSAVDMKGFTAFSGLASQTVSARVLLLVGAVALAILWRRGELNRVLFAISVYGAAIEAALAPRFSRAASRSGFPWRRALQLRGAT